MKVEEVWESFSMTDKKDIATTPGLWVCLRMQLRNGSQEEQDKIKANLKKLAADTQGIGTTNGTDAKTNSGTGSEAAKPISMGAHWSMMQMQQQTFNHYMWSRGFNYDPTFGKMW